VQTPAATLAEPGATSAHDAAPTSQPRTAPTVRRHTAVGTIPRLPSAPLPVASAPHVSSPPVASTPTVATVTTVPARLPSGPSSSFGLGSVLGAAGGLTGFLVLALVALAAVAVPHGGRTLRLPAAPAPRPMAALVLERPG
jgi:hypothetical protein